jgi:hypothetical protein
MLLLLLLLDALDADGLLSGPPQGFCCSAAIGA